MTGRNDDGSRGLDVESRLRTFVDAELLPDLGIEPARFWAGLADIVARFTPANRDLLVVRNDLQAKIDAWHREHGGAPDPDGYREFLTEIGYLEERGEPFEIDTQNVDTEIAEVAGPQLVVPVSNARFALNAANARWGSLYDALYGSDVIPVTEGREPGDAYNPVRGASVVAYACDFLDEVVPLAAGSNADVVEYRVDDKASGATLQIRLDGDRTTTLADERQFVGHAGDGSRRQILLRNNGLHVVVHTDPDHPVGKVSPAGVSDIELEAAITTIQDCEDSVAAVDAEDKVNVYRNWLGLMRGTLEATFDKGGRSQTRRLNADRQFTDRSGNPMTLPGRSLMLVRNVGHLMTTPAVKDSDGEEVFEGILDTVMTTACALYDLRRQGERQNSRTGSVYIVKPKMHGSAEVEFTDRLFAAVEELFELDRHTLKVGVMDEERRTTVNLEECIRRVRHRLVFINTGFLDRTGDEIHTSMEAGPMLRKNDIKAEPWIQAYEDRNVDVGIRCGLPGRAQIGKGMWPKPDEMREMMETKQAHPEAGANCAWVPSPTAATLHAMHYHRVDVHAVQHALAKRREASLDAILSPPLGDPSSLTADAIQSELDNNAQGILGYVVRWIDQGIGCSKVPDIDDVGLMEDRATLRISSQHIANWLHHGVCDEQQVTETFQRMAKVVDEQNVGDPGYVSMASGFEGVAFRAALALALEGRAQPNGYTEPLLHHYRRERKQTAT